MIQPNTWVGTGTEAKNETESETGMGTKIGNGVGTENGIETVTKFDLRLRPRLKLGLELR